MRSAEAIVRCRFACGVEAVAQGFPEQAGYDIYEGCCADAATGWTENQFDDWVYQLADKYLGRDRADETPLIDLYEEIVCIMGRYATAFAGRSE